MSFKKFLLLLMMAAVMFSCDTAAKDDDDDDKDPPTVSGPTTVSGVTATITIDGTKDTTWDNVTPVADPEAADSWAQNASQGNVQDPCGFNFTNTYIANDTSKLYIAIELDNVTWGAKDVQFFIDKVSDTTGVSNFGSGTTWSWSDKNVVFSDSTVEAVIATYDGGFGAFSFLNATEASINTNVAHARSGNSNLVEVSLDLSAINLSSGDKIRLAIVASNDYDGSPSLFDSAFDSKLTSPEADNDPAYVIYTIN